MSLAVRIARIGRHDLPLPDYRTEGAAGMDIRACLSTPIELVSGECRAVPTGFSLEIPAGFEVQLRARSGLALHHGIGLANGIGTVDSDYRGEVAVILINLGKAPVTIAHGDRIAQAVLAPVTRCLWQEVETLSTSDRGIGGFGSTGR
ncbi:MAG: dUTP diphosphatase [Pseudomonadota bacterium]